jgi:MFS family permease
VPDALMGRVAAASRLTAYSAGPLGALLGGWLAHVAGLRAPFVAGAAVLVVMAFMAARLTSNSRIDAALAEAASTEAISTDAIGPVPNSPEPISTEPISPEPISTEPISTEPPVGTAAESPA